MKKISACIILIFYSFTVIACSDDIDYTREYYIDGQVIFQNSNIRLNVNLLGEKSKEAYKKMVERLTAIDEDISLTRESSAVSRFNNSENAGEENGFVIIKDTFLIIKMAIELEIETRHAFSIAVPNLSDIWSLTIPNTNSDYGKINPLDTVLPSESEISAAKANCNINDLHIKQLENGDYFIYKDNKNLKIDLGGIAKGYCADICKEIAGEYELLSAVIDISGNIVLYNKCFDGNKFIPWEVGIAQSRAKYNFWNSRPDSCLISIDNTVSFVTSGDYQRYYVHSSGISPCHIINPVTGIPVGIEKKNGREYKMQDENVSSATIICESSARADAFATAVCVMGLESGVEFLSGLDDIKAIIYTEKNYNNKSELYDIYSVEEYMHSKMAIVGKVNIINNGINNQYELF